MHVQLGIRVLYNRKYHFIIFQVFKILKLMFNLSLLRWLRNTQGSLDTEENWK